MPIEPPPEYAAAVEAINLMIRTLRSALPEMSSKERALFTLTAVMGAARRAGVTEEEIRAALVLTQHVRPDD
jgi:hypothetical protein